MEALYFTLGGIFKGGFNYGLDRFFLIASIILGLILLVVTASINMDVKEKLKFLTDPHSIEMVQKKAKAQKRAAKWFLIPLLLFCLFCLLLLTDGLA